METTSISFTLNNVRSVQSKTVFAYLDVELTLAGVSLTLHGVSARHVPGGGCSIHLPTYRNERGEWISAVSLPADLRDPLCDQILEHLMELGLAKPRYQAQVA